MDAFKGSDNIASILIGQDQMKKFPNGAFRKSWMGDATAKTAVIATYKTGAENTLTAITDYTVGTTMKTAWFVLTGVDFPQNETVVELNGCTPITAVLMRALELRSQRLLVADDTGASEGLCVVTDPGNDADAVIGQLAWGTPGEGSFTGAGPTVKALGADVHVTGKNITGVTPWVSFICH
jgi:hypothetical protein